MLTKNVSRAIEIKTDFSLPTFRYVQDRWSTTREKNVAEMAATWVQDPSRVLVLTDPKFGANPLVVLSKDLFETLVKLLQDIMSGEVQVRTDVQTLLDAVAILQSRVTEQGLDRQDHILGNAIQIISRMQGQVNSSLSFRSPVRQVLPTPLSQEEIEVAESLPEDEEAQ